MLIFYKIVICGYLCMWMILVFIMVIVLGFVFDCFLIGFVNFCLIFVYIVLGELYWRKLVKYEVICWIVIVK